MKFIFTTLCLGALFPVLAQSVHLETSFGNAGIAITPNTSEINCIAIDAGGNIFSAGYSLESGSTGIYHLTLTKHDQNGTIVPGFGTNGIVTTTVEYSEMPLDIQLQPDGKILVAGSAYMGPGQNGPGDYRSFVVRYHPNGAPDNSFAINGILELPYSDSHIASIILLADGSIVLAGNSFGSASLTKIDSNGVPVTSFGNNNGSVFLSDGTYYFILWDAIRLNDNSLLCVGYDGSDAGNSKLSYCKVDLNGQLVTGFGQNGKVVLDLYNTQPEVIEFLNTVKQHTNGELFIGGQASTPVILKINPVNGSLNTAFGTNGILHFSHPFTDMEIQPDGKFLIGGSGEVSDYNAGFFITRLNSDGSLDNSFNGTGTFTADPSPGNDYLQTLKCTSNGSILVGGSSPLLNNNSDFMLAKVSIGENLNVNEYDSEKLTAYPNPFSGELFLTIPSQELSVISLTDAAGRIVTTIQNPQTNQLELEFLEKGTYQLSLTNKSTGEVSFQTIVKH